MAKKPVDWAAYDTGEDDSQFAMEFSAITQHRRKKWKSRGDIPDDFHQDEPFFLRHILYRRKLNMNSIVLIVGAVRTGKSYMALKLAERYCKILGKEFDVTKQCSFDIIPFLKWSQTETDNVYVLDEVGVSLNPQEWYSIQSRIFRNFTQAQGFRRNVMILVLPNASFLLKAIRFMCNYVIETRHQGTGTIRKLIMDHTRGKGYFLNMGTIKFHLPKKKNIKGYETMKKVWNDKMLKEDIEHLLRGEEKKKQEIDEFYIPKDEIIEPILSLKPKSYL